MIYPTPLSKCVFLLQFGLFFFGGLFVADSAVLQDLTLHYFGTEDDASILLRVPGCVTVAFAATGAAGALVEKSRGQLLTIAGKLLLEDTRRGEDRAQCGGDSLLFAPATDFAGEIELDFVLNNNEGRGEEHRKGTIIVSPTRDPPEAVDDEFFVSPGEWALLPVLLNDMDADIAVPVCVAPGANEEEIAVRVVMPFSKKTTNTTSQITISFGSDGPKQPCIEKDSGSAFSASDVDVLVCVVRAEKTLPDSSVPTDVVISIGISSYVLGGVKAGSTVVITHNEHIGSVLSFGAHFASESLPRCKELRIASVSEPGNGHAMALPLPASQRAQLGAIRVGLGSTGGVWIGGSPVSPTHGLSPGSSQNLPLVIAYHAAPGFVGDDSFSYDIGDGQPGSSQRTTGTVTVHVRDSKVEVTADGQKVEERLTSSHSSTSSSSSCRTWKCIVQSFDGRHNSFSQPDNGAMMTPLRRVAPSAYADKIDSPSGASRPSTRVISNALFSQPTGENVYSREGLSELHVHFGQFLTHDIDFSTPLADFKAEGNFVIPIPADDPWFVGQTTMRFRRSGPQHGTGAGTDVPREQLNKITSFLDLNVIYGTLVGRNRGLRTLTGGKLLHMVGLQQSSNNSAAAAAATTGSAEEKVRLTDTHCFEDATGAQHCRPARGTVEHLSLNFNHMPNLNLLGKARETLFVSGDNRVNVQPGLTAMHTLLAREHNAVADEIQASLIRASDDHRYHASRTEGPSDALWRAAHPHAPSFHEPSVPAFSQPVLMELPGVSEKLPAVTQYPSPPWYPQAFDGSLASLRAYDEAIFQTARAVTRAKWQAIVWYEWLPSVLGPDHFAALPRFVPGRDHERVDAASTTEFATAAFRFGHSQIGSSMRRVDSATGCPAESGPISLRDAYFTAARILAEGGVDPVISGSLIGLAQEVDTRAVDEVRNLLFATHTQGFDLLAFNIQRGRDHGLPDYNTVRVALGLPRANTFANITGGGPDCEVASTLSDLYGGNVDDIDLLVGGLAEPHVPGGSVGPLFAALIADVFVRIRDSDRFWFEDPAAPQAALLSRIATLDEFRSTRIADLLSRTSEALDGRFGLEVVSSASMSRENVIVGEEEEEEEKEKEKEEKSSTGLTKAKLNSKGVRLTPALRDSLFFARPNVLRSLDSVCGGSWSAEIEALDEGLAAME